jgi:hypothetical protein
MKTHFIFTVWIAVAWLESATAQIQDTLPYRPAAVVGQDTLRGDSLLTVQDSVVEDSVPSKKRFFYRVFKENYPNPNMALYLSLAIPGGGQIYNERWWKLPFVYGAYGGLIYAVQYNTTNYRRLRDAYIAELNGQPHEFSDTRLKADDLKRLRDGFDKNKQLSYIGIFAVHLLQSAEAFVDCHLRTFDVSDDLSLRLKPSFIPAAPDAPSSLGIGFALTFAPKRLDPKKLF